MPSTNTPKNPIKAVNDKIRRMEKKLTARIEELEKRVGGPVFGTTDESPIPVKERWNPKIDDLVVATDEMRSMQPLWRPAPRDVGRVVECKMNGNLIIAWDTVNDNTPYCYQRKRVRPATPEEVDDYNRRKEWGKVDELQEGDAYNGHDALSLYNDLVSLGVPVAPVGCSRGDAAGFSMHKALGAWDGICLYGRTSEREQEVNRLPKEEILRRAKGTASKLAEAKRKEEESRPLEWGTRVHCMGEKGPEGIVIGVSGDGTHHVNMRETCCTITYSRKDLFPTVIPNKQDK